MIQDLYNLLVQNNFSYSTDTRTLAAGDIFFALSGENFNGNTFVQQALEKGASYVVIDDVNFRIENDGRYILVDSSYDIFLEIANHHRGQFQIPIIGIAGSNGKTTTKELTTAILSKKYTVLSTAHNDNNNLGVAKTLLGLRGNHEIAVIELGSNTPGELYRAIDLAQPTHGLVTNIGKEHLEFFDSLEGVVEEECGFYYFLHENNAYILAPADDLLIKDYLSSHNIVPDTIYGADIRIADYGKTTLDILWKGNAIPTSFFGSHNKQNIAAAIAIGEIFDVDEKDIIAAIAQYVPANIRSQVIERGSTTFILDFYNANPTSMRLALESFQNVQTEKKKIVILGDMLEMGDHAEIEHQAIVEYVLTMDIDNAFLAGPYFGKIESKYHHFEKVDDLVVALTDCNLENSLVLIKSSKGILYIHEGFRELFDF